MSSPQGVFKFRTIGFNAIEKLDIRRLDAAGCFFRGDEFAVGFLKAAYARQARAQGAMKPRPKRVIDIQGLRRGVERLLKQCNGLIGLLVLDEQLGKLALDGKHALVPLVTLNQDAVLHGTSLGGFGLLRSAPSNVELAKAIVHALGFVFILA